MQVKMSDCLSRRLTIVLYKVQTDTVKLFRHFNGRPKR